MRNTPLQRPWNVVWRKHLHFWCLWICGLLSPGWTQQAAIVGEAVYTMGPQGVLRPGVVLVEDSRIKAVGPPEAVSLPEGWPVYRARVVTPGLIDAHTVVGLAGMYNVPADQDQNELTDPNQAELRAVDGYNPEEPLIAYLRSLGVTTIQAGPAPVNPIAGQAGIFKTSGHVLDEVLVKFPSAMLFTLGEAPKEVYGRRHKPPSTRMATAALIRKALNKARIYLQKKQTSGRKKEAGSEAELDLKSEALIPVIQGRLPALFTAHREDDILTALRIGREFNLDLILDGATEAYLVADVLARAGVPVIVHPTMQRIDRMEHYNTSLENAAILARRGIPIAFQSGYESYVPKTRVVLFEAAIAMANGLGFERALRALTRDAASMLGIADRVGSLEPGKDADVVLFNGDPFEYTSHVLRVFVNGHLAYSHAEETGK